ncbi:F0F1 ATP synthase subunit B family protein [Rhodopirellula sp. JC639]|uniref:F0F1 ATP synthase subunit B family protein n=1 Tax=Stieleria mannarensis TaxID=2755585 RepID=UPI0015FF2C7F|nr:hypothetical protein [Rhodopirellula sp. JC639]
MTIDWFTFVAQIINFLILVALLRWLLYEPIIAAMAQREAKISQQFHQAETKLAEANQNAALYRQKTAEFEATREAMLQDVRQELLEHRERLTREAREEVERKRGEWIDALAREQSDAATEVRRQVGEIAIDSARQTLKELADAELETRIAEKFIAQIEQLEDQRRDEIAALLSDDSAEVSVRSSFELNDDVRGRLRRVLRERLDYHGDVTCEQSDELICGLQLDAGGYGIQWNVDDFVDGIHSEFAKRLEGHS